MDKIYTVMVMTDLKPDEKTGCPEFGSSRLVGWFPEFDMADSSVKENALDINETCYHYALIEECRQGLYSPASADSRWWYQYNKEKDEYLPIAEPEFVKHFCGFTIG